MDVFLRTLLLGIADGSVYALAATGLVLTYKTSGVLNFGYGGLVLFATFVYWQLVVPWGWPPLLAALLVVLVVAPLMGSTLDRQLFRRIEGQPVVISVIATVGLAVLLQGLVLFIWGGESRSVPSLFPAGSVPLPAGARIGIEQLGIIAVAAGGAALLAAMLRYTRIGVAFRAVVDNRPLAGLMAVNTGLVSGTAWALGASFAALTGILLTPKLILEPDRLPFLILLPVLAAAIVGYLRSLPLAYAGGLMLGIAQNLAIQYGGFRGSRIAGSVPFVIITVALLAAPRAIRLAGLGASFVVRTREIAARSATHAGAAVAAATLLVLAVFPAIADANSWWIAMTRATTLAIVFLSLVILTGYSGQVSLGHTAFMGVAAFLMGHLVAGSVFGITLSPWLALVVGPIAAGAVGALIGVVASRLHGLFLALMTLAFAFMAQELFFNEPSISGGEGGIGIPRPPGVDSQPGLYYLTLVALVLCAGLAMNLRSGRTGRVLGAMRDSETAARSLGINVVRYKVAIFALSAFVAGLGGVLNSMILESATQRSFFPFYSLIFLTVAVIGGIFHVGGAITAGLFFGLYPKIFGQYGVSGRLQLIFFGLGATLALAHNPEGMFGELRRGAAALMRARSRASHTPEPDDDVARAPAPVAGGQR